MLRRTSFWTLLLIIILFGGVGYYYQEELLALVVPAQEAETEEETVASAPVRRGNMLIAVGGVGELLPSRAINLSFSASGTIQEIFVQVGDQVEAGQILAVLDESDLQRQVIQSAIDVRSAELTMDDLLAEPSAVDMAAAQASFAEAQVAYDAIIAPPSEEELIAARSQLASAEAALNQLFVGLSDDELLTLNADLRSTEVALRQAQSAYDQVKWRADAGATSQAADLQNATIGYEKALAQFNVSTAGPASDQIAAARASVAQAQEALNLLEEGPDAMELLAADAKVAQAQATLDELNNGPDDNELELADLNVQQARHNMDAVMADLEGATIKAPFSGVVTAVNASQGEQIGTESIVTLAESETAEVQFWMEELDIEYVSIGNRITYLFEAFPDVEFSGQLRRIEPALVELEGAPAVQAWGSINLEAHPVTPLFGMNTEVEIIAGEANNALLVPIQSLRELVPGSFAVFVIDEGGELEMRPVEVGLRDFINAEITSGIEEGETVSTGDIQTQ
ncbi:MAG: biotin/lipoyl-binding protein [Chloroflexota bacterium]